jgi:hypothetical protein
MKSHSLTIILILISLLACQDDNTRTPQFIIEASLFAGEPIDDIKIKALTPIDQMDTLERTIDNAIVTLEKNNSRYELNFVIDHYVYSGNDLSVEPGDLFKIEVTVGNRTAFAETIVPDLPQALSLTESEIIVPTLFLSASLADQLGDLFFNNRTTAKWHNPNETLHFIVIEPVINQFDPMFPSGFPQSALDFLSGFKFAPSATKVDTFSIIGIAFESYGRHRVKVYRVNQEYADLFDNPTQDSRDLTAAPTNVVNGFGLFSAFTTDSVFFDIVRQ